ncbi:hypothetical protein Tco_0044390 [Tanacetum coccineum]
MDVHDNDASESSQPSWGKSKLEYKFQDQENSEDIFSLGSALEDFICAVFIPDRNIARPAGTRIGQEHLKSYALKTMDPPPPWNKASNDLEREHRVKDIYFLPSTKISYFKWKKQYLPFDLTKKGEGKQRARAYEGEDKLL